jgi:hypothetical protein
MPAVKSCRKARSAGAGDAEVNHNANARPLPPPWPEGCLLLEVQQSTDGIHLVLAEVLPGRFQAFTQRLDHLGDTITAVAPWLTVQELAACAECARVFGDVPPLAGPTND